MMQKIAKLIRVENDKRVEGGRIRSRFFYLKSLLEKDIVNASAQRQTVPRGTQAFRNFTERTNNNYMEKVMRQYRERLWICSCVFMISTAERLWLAIKILVRLQEEHSEKMWWLCCRIQFCFKIPYSTIWNTQMHKQHKMKKTSTSEVSHAIIRIDRKLPRAVGWLNHRKEKLRGI